MIEHFVERVETSEDTRRRAVAALGFDEPPTEEKLNRADFGSDEAYFHACAELAVRNHSEEYRKEYEKIRKQYNAQQRAEAEAAAEKQHQEEIQKAIRDCVLRPEEQKRVDNDARSRAQTDLAAGVISYDQFGATVERYAEAGTKSAKAAKVHAADFNKQIREAMAAARGRI